tara:strand:- start:3398 stop:3541 length:144 start_codon:yes stop_codon:yes gene_type:complete
MERQITEQVGKENQGYDRRAAVEILKELQNDPEAREEARRIAQMTKL